MQEKTVSERLDDVIEELEEKEINEVHLIIAIIKRKIINLINKNMKLLEDEFNINCERYIKNGIDFIKEKDEILNGYKLEFDKIALKFEEEYMNLGLEIQEIQSNQKEAILEMKKTILLKKEYIESGEYENYIKNIEDLENQRDNCLVKSEFDKIINRLDNMENPIEIYNKQIDMYAEKYIKYCGLEETCILKLTECGDNIEESINSIMQYDVGKLVVKKKSIFSKFSNLFSKIGGAKKFEKRYLARKRENIVKIKTSTNSILDKIDEDINNILLILDACNSKINKACKIVEEV